MRNINTIDKGIYKLKVLAWYVSILLTLFAILGYKNVTWFVVFIPLIIIYGTEIIIFSIISLYTFKRFKNKK